jgi:hypothetical protein
MIINGGDFMLCNTCDNADRYKDAILDEVIAM